MTPRKESLARPHNRRGSRQRKMRSVFEVVRRFHVFLSLWKPVTHNTSWCAFGLTVPEGGGLYPALLTRDAQPSLRQDHQTEADNENAA